MVFFFSCNNAEDSGRQQTAGTGESNGIGSVSKSETEEPTDGETTDDPGAGTGDDTSDDGSTGPKETQVGFACEPGEAKFQIDNGDIETYAAKPSATVPKDERVTAGTISYLKPEDPSGAYYLGYVSATSEGNVPGDVFAARITFTPTAKGEVYTCPTEMEQNYTKYIEGSATTPVIRHFEGIALDFYANAACEGDVVIKKLAFCIHSHSDP